MISHQFKVGYGTIALTSFLLVLMNDALSRMNINSSVANGSTYFSAVLSVVSVFCLVILAFKFRWKGVMPDKALVVLKLFLFWSVVTLIRGAFNAQDYWDWKNLLMSYSFTILVPLVIVLGLNYEVCVKLLRFIVSKWFIFCFLALPYTRSTDSEFFARMVLPVSFFIVLLPYLKPRWRNLVLVVAAVSVVMDLAYRTNEIRIVMPIILLLLYYSRHLVKASVLNMTAIVMLCVPLILLSLGVSGQFNVFRDNPLDFRVTSSKLGMDGTQSLAADTRTLLYRDVFNSMREKDSSFLIGEGGGAEYWSVLFADFSINQRGRYGCEVGFLNTVLYSGAVGVLLYALMLFIPAFYAINRSNNFLCKMLALFLVLHWVIFFIEDISNLDMNYFFIWLTVGLCLSKKFRSLTDSEIRQFFLFNRHTVRNADAAPLLNFRPNFSK